MKTARQNMLIEIISSSEIETQEELSEALRSRGFAATQATISRDIKELRLTKAPRPGGKYCYAVPPGETAGAGWSPERLQSIFRECVIRVQAAQNMVVIKTLPGLASGACLALDSMEGQGIVGTIAGDDTAFVVMPDVKAAAAMRDVINRML